MRKIKMTVMAVVALVGLSGCATLFGPTVSATPGPYKPIEGLQVDQSECRHHADRQVAAGIEAVNNYEAASIALGGALGADIPYETDLSLKQAYDRAYAQCMNAKGNQVHGFDQLRAEPPPLN